MPRFTELAQWLTWMEQLHPSEIDLGLSRVAAVAKKLHIPTRLPSSTHVITVAGTNGKGSCVTALQHLCLANGRTVGAFTSPHMLRYNERIQINGQEVSDAQICDAFARIDFARDDISLTYFEFGTLAALLLFNDQPLDYWLLEVGLGGRLDAVNIVDADVAIITSIDLDHESWLGSTRDVIACEKAGIIKTHSQVICADENPPSSLVDILNNHTQSSYLIHRDFSYTQAQKKLLVALNIGSSTETNMEFTEPSLPFPSIAAALQAFLLLNSRERLLELTSVLPEIALKGRFEKHTFNGSSIILDVAHNPAASAHLVKRLKAIECKRYVVVIAIMADKAITETIQPLCDIADHWVCTEILDMPRCEKADALAHNVLQTVDSPVEAVCFFDHALERALHIADENRLNILVVGSFFTVSAAQRYLISRSML